MWIIAVLVCIISTAVIAWRSTKDNFFTWATFGFVAIAASILYLLTLM